MKTNIKIIECISNISGVDVALQRIKIHWVNENDSNPFRREATEIIYLKIGIIIRELTELKRLAKLDDHLNKILLTLEPFTRELDYYKVGIKSYRDTYIAHYNRGNNYKFQSFGDNLSPNLILPRANAELEFLLNVTHLFSKMLIHFYVEEWSIFQKNMLDRFEGSIMEFSKSFVPRKPIMMGDRITEVNKLAIQNGLIPDNSELIILCKRE
jgi:hypothetical protein